MRKYLERMLEEKKDLEGKIKKAKKTIENNPFGMDKHQVILLAEQVKAMEVYLGCLIDRIEYEEKKAGGNSNE